MSYRRRGLMIGHREEQGRVTAQTAKVTRVAGRQMIQGVGFAFMDVWFPAAYQERPIATFGAEMDENFPFNERTFSFAKMVVAKWYREERSDGYPGNYIGCQLAIAADGYTEQQMWVHWTFEGLAIRSPITAGDPQDIAVVL